jgi:hypothetical protein
MCYILVWVHITLMVNIDGGAMNIRGFVGVYYQTYVHTYICTCLRCLMAETVTEYRELT